LCDRGGNIIIDAGQSPVDCVDLISALVAGAYAATKELATVLGEDEFSAIFHQGADSNIFISAIGEEVLLLAIFNDDSNAGLVKMAAQRTCRDIRKVFDVVMDRDEVEIDDLTKSFVVNKGPLF
jgi:predicted regulator of Ras-like GTPase activity (Roadblock/LC7/MglB family)